MTAPARKPIDGRRRQLYGKIHIARKALALDDDTYRDILRARYGKESSTRLSPAQLVDLVEHFKSLGFKPARKAPARAGTRKLADHEVAKKIRALWVSLYHLGLLQEPSESALGSFVKRQTGVDDLHWLRPAQARSVIEALKGWATREAGVDWSPYPFLEGPHYAPRLRVLEAQWRLLHRLGQVERMDVFALHAWVTTHYGHGTRISIHNLSDADADAAIAELGEWIRRTKTPKGCG